MRDCHNMGLKNTMATITTLRNIFFFRVDAEMLPLSLASGIVNPPMVRRAVSCAWLTAI